MIKNRTFIVTGSSRGIGLSISKKLLKNGGTVVGVSRQKSNQEIKNENYHHFPLDLFEIQKIDNSFRKILKTFPHTDCLISNAGYGSFKSIEEFKNDEIIKMLNLNLISHLLICKILVPHFKKKKKGDLIFLGSEASHLPGKKGSVYCASKFGLRGFTQSLRKECSNRNIKVTLINPGMVKTNFFKNQNFEPRDTDTSVLKSKEVAKTILNTLKSSSGAVYDEINITPLNKIIDKK